MRAAAAVLAAALAALAGGCGGGDHSSSATTEATAPPKGKPAPVRTAPRTATTTAPRGGGGGAGGGGATAPESQPGGAGDEQPIATPAELTGRGGRITPATVSVPPYIAIRVDLRSADGRAYGLRFPGHSPLRAGSALTLSGLRPGRAVVGEPVGAGSRVRIVANAEPGP